MSLNIKEQTCRRGIKGKLKRGILFREQTQKAVNEERVMYFLQKYFS